MCIWGHLREVPRLYHLKKGIEIDPDKVKAIIQMPSSEKFKEIARITRKVGLHKAVYLKFIRKVSTFHKTSEKEHAFHLGSNLSKMLLKVSNST